MNSALQNSNKISEVGKYFYSNKTFARVCVIILLLKKMNTHTLENVNYYIDLSRTDLLRTVPYRTAKH